MVNIVVILMLISAFIMVSYCIWMFVNEKKKEKFYDEIVFGKGCRKRWRKERRKAFIQKLKRIFL